FSLIVAVAGFAIGLSLVGQSLGDDADDRARLWKKMKEALLSPDGNQYFEQAVKDALLPTLDGTILSSSPTEHPSKFLVAMPGSDIPEATLKLKGSLIRSLRLLIFAEKPLPPGTPVSFDGVAKGFKAEPFMLTFEVRTVNRA